MNREDLVEFLRKNLAISIDATVAPSAILVGLSLNVDGKWEEISSDTLSIDMLDLPAQKK